MKHGPRSEQSAGRVLPMSGTTRYFFAPIAYSDSNVRR